MADMSRDGTGKCREGAGSRESFWRAHVARWQGSGESIRGYCRARGISESGFHFWKRELRRRDARRASREEGPAFAEVRLTAVPAASLEVVCDTPRRILVHPGFDAETLARVVAVLERGDAREACRC